MKLDTEIKFHLFFLALSICLQSAVFIISSLLAYMIFYKAKDRGHNPGEIGLFVGVSTILFFVIAIWLGWVGFISALIFAPILTLILGFRYTVKTRDLLIDDPTSGL